MRLVACVASLTRTLRAGNSCCNNSEQTCSSNPPSAQKCSIFPFSDSTRSNDKGRLSWAVISCSLAQPGGKCLFKTDWFDLEKLLVYMFNLEICEVSCHWKNKEQLTNFYNIWENKILCQRVQTKSQHPKKELPRCPCTSPSWFSKMLFWHQQQ